jgi:hypothetical protein
MAVKCTKCGEELLGAVNRCWKCGQTFAVHPQADGQPPVRVDTATIGDEQPMDAVVLEEGLAEAAMAQYAAAQVVRPRPISTSERIDAKRKSLMAMGGTVGSLVLAIFALAIAAFRFEAALIAALGLVMGIWGLYSPRRGLALVAMLLCWLGIGLGTYTGARQLYIHILKSRPPVVQETTLP